MLRAAYRQPLDQPIISVQPLSAINLNGAVEAIEPGQDWEVIVDFHPNGTLDLQSFYTRLEEMGTSIQVGEGDGMYRMHIHVPDKTEYQPIDYIKGLGTISNVAIENLMIQTGGTSQPGNIESLNLQGIEPGQNAVIAVAPGIGLARVFASLGVTALIEGGQTMNPSTQEILESFEDLPTDMIILLPNNKNIVLAANQAKELTVKQVTVIPSVSVPQGIAAMFAWEADGDYEKVTKNMASALNDIHTAEITTATRSVEIDGVTCEAGQVIGLLNGKLASSGESLEEVLQSTLQLGEAEQAELITLYYGADLSAAEANQLGDGIRETYSEQELEVHEGGQPHYQIILSIE
jgi:dihydroxyacetone kinase-like predicted kinase